MMRVMVDYCIRFHERRQECEVLEQKTDTQKDDISKTLPRRQMSLHHIHYFDSVYVLKPRFSSLCSLASSGDKTFEDFRQEVGRKSDITAWVETPIKAILNAERVLGGIKDVRDELIILSSIVNYQNTIQFQVGVQRALE